MPRDRATQPPPPSRLDAWLSVFVDELQRIRPHMSLKLANIVGQQEYAATRDPKEAAAAYHARQEPGVPAKRTGKRR